MVYFKQSGHCTRCGDPFGGNRATAFMVREEVAWTVLADGLALTQREIVPVTLCTALTLPAGLRMTKWRRRTCDARF